MHPSLMVSTHSRPKAAGTGAAKSWYFEDVSTHSRPKAAGIGNKAAFGGQDVSTHSRPKAAGKIDLPYTFCEHVSTHSRPKAAGKYWSKWKNDQNSFNTQPPEGGWLQSKNIVMANSLFQHTAARRRLVPYVPYTLGGYLFQHTAARRRLDAETLQALNTMIVSTHSRPKAAG